MAKSHLPKSKQDFDQARHFSALSLENMYQFWTFFRRDFNDCARKNGFTMFLNVELIGDRLILALESCAQTNDTKPLLEMSLTIMNPKNVDHYYLITDRAPNQPLNENFGTLYDEGKIVVKRYPKEDGLPIDLLSRCKAEILVASSPQQQLAYKTYDCNGPVLH